MQSNHYKKITFDDVQTGDSNYWEFGVYSLTVNIITSRELRDFRNDDVVFPKDCVCPQI